MAKDEFKEDMPLNAGLFTSFLRNVPQTEVKNETFGINVHKNVRYFIFDCESKMPCGEIAKGKTFVIHFFPDCSVWLEKYNGWLEQQCNSFGFIRDFDVEKHLKFEVSRFDFCKEVYLS